MGVIYLILNPKGNYYVGQTVNLKRRMAGHKCAANKKNLTYLLYHSINKYGWDNHHFETLEDVPKERLNEREIAWIAFYNSYFKNNPRGMNMSPGGVIVNSSWKHDVARVKKASQRLLGKGFFTGKKHSEETKQVLSEKARAYNKANNKHFPKWALEKEWQRKRKPVVCYNNKGEFIAEFETVNQAAICLNVDRTLISMVLNKKCQQIKQMVFRYKTEKYPLLIDVSDFHFLKMKRPILMLNRKKEIIREYAQAREAAEDLNINIDSIHRVVKLDYHFMRGFDYTFRYKDEYEASVTKQVINN